METIDRAAEAVLAEVPSWIWDGERLPVPVEDIADSHFGLLVREADDLSAIPGVPYLPGDHSLSGLLLPEAGLIVVNATEAREWPGRRRFTIGHELGHWCMHRAQHEPVYCRSTSVSEGDGAAQKRPPEEDEANRFAAALLMPAGLMRRHYERYRARDRERCFSLLCERFNVSGAAMGRRLHAVIP
jgi:IrrE N-terminal-like domain